MADSRQKNTQNDKGRIEKDRLPGVEFDRPVLVVRREKEEHDARDESKQVTKGACRILT